MDTDEAATEDARLTLRDLGRRYRGYTKALARAASRRPQHEEVVVAIHTAIVVHGVRVTQVAADLGMNRVQMDRDYGWVWRPDAVRPKWAEEFDTSTLPGWAD